MLHIRAHFRDLQICCHVFPELEYVPQSVVRSVPSSTNCCRSDVQQGVLTTSIRCMQACDFRHPMIATGLPSVAAASLKKEKCKHAARVRRLDECTLFGELQATLPYETKFIDRNSVIRLAIHACRSARLLENAREAETRLETDQLFPDVAEDIEGVLDGFLMLIDENGYIYYASDSVSEHLDTPLNAILGMQIQSFVTSEADALEILSLPNYSGTFHVLPAALALLRF